MEPRRDSVEPPRQQERYELPPKIGLPFDTDTSVNSPHHTLGYKPHQAAPGVDVQRRLTAAESRLTAVEKVPSLKLGRYASQSIPNATFTTIAWDTVVSQHNIGRSGSTITIREPGIYLFTLNVGWKSDTTGIRLARLVFGSAFNRRVGGPGLAVNAAVYSLSYVQHCDAGETLTADVYQNSGADLDTSNLSDVRPILDIIRLGSS